MLHLHLSNRPEALATALAERLRAEPLPLFEVEPVVVPSTASARWLGFRLADALGASAQVAMPFAAAFVWQLFGRVLPDVAARNPFDRPALQWRLLRQVAGSEAVPLRRYLAGDDGSRAQELAVRLAALFDRYLVERPDWLLAWGAGRRVGLGPDEAWQAGLWQALLAELADVPAEHPRERFLAALARSPQARQRLPRRISLFAVEAMPALYWEVFAGLAEWIDVHVFVLSPCREYWGDLERVRTRLRLELEQPDAAALIDSGHPLLASLGRARQPAVVRLADTLGERGGNESAYFVAPSASLLGRLQRDLLDLTESRGCPVDASLQVHACHGALREAEVLHDRLLDLFERLPGLQPADLLILTPDIETYGPLVEAVLQHAAPSRRIPCTLADRPLGQAPLWRALRRLCAVAAGELDAESTLGLLDEPAVRRAFDIAADDLPLLRDWVAAAGIRWAEDGTARARRGLPADDAHSWRAGLRRLLLGVALPDTETRLYGDLLPLPHVEGTRAELLGRLVDFAEAVFDVSRKVGAGRTAGDWCEWLLATLARCCAPDESDPAEASAAQQLRSALAELAGLARGAGCTTPLPLSAILREIDAALAERAPPQAFLSGAATIAALQPGRPVPARVICLVGMNDGAWPQPVPQPGFDLLAKYPRPGDRNRRAEERHALLETLLCARDALVVTFTGNDPRSNVALPPAAPLSEVLDTLAAMTGLAAARFIVSHPLQPFGTAYHDRSDERLFSFDAEQCLPATRAPAAFLAAEPVSRDDGAELRVELAQLRRFFAHPVRHFLRERLGIHLDAGEELLDIHEPFVPDRLEAYRLRATAFALRSAGATDAEIVRQLRARGWLPHGVAGELAAAAANAAMEALWQRTRPWREAASQPAIDLEFRAHGVTLTGRIDGLTEAGSWRVRHGRMRARDRFDLWLDHLALQVAAPPGAVRSSVLVTRDSVLELPPVLEADRLLADLLAIWREGQHAALPFYPETARAWLTEGKWRRAWEGDSFNGSPGERDDPYVRLALRDRGDDSPGECFQALAQRILAPLLAVEAADD